MMIGRMKACRVSAATRGASAALLTAALLLSIPTILHADGAGDACTLLLPCADARGCPDLVVGGLEYWDTGLVNYASTSCAVLEGQIGPGLRRILRFPTSIGNHGFGDFVLGGVGRNPSLFEYATCHGHQHYKDYADYRLWTPPGYAAWRALRAANPGICSPSLLAAYPEVAAQMYAGHKQGFCVVDVEPICANAGEYRYDDCNSNQGVSAGWADVYDISLTGQWIDISFIPSGAYVLEIEVNALRHVEETDYSNNAAAVMVRF